MAINGQVVLAVIPARGGSKRVPRKNLREYRGKSLIEWAYKSARDSKYVDHVVCTTDDEEIWMHAFSMGDVIRRPTELGSDTASSEDVLRHAMKEVDFPCEWVVMLQPTSPLRTAEDIDACIERAQMGHGCISYRQGGNWDKNGAVYVASREWIEKHDFSHQGLMKYFMDEDRSLDINTEEDFCK